MSRSDWTNKNGRWVRRKPSRRIPRGGYRTRAPRARSAHAVRVCDVADQHGISDAAAVRRLVREGYTMVWAERHADRERPVSASVAIKLAEDGVDPGSLYGVR